MPPPDTEFFKRRVWRTIPNDVQDNKNAAFRFKIMSYNVLAQSLVRRDYYPYAQQTALNAKNRERNILNECLHWDADILCLQEVEPHIIKELRVLGGYRVEFVHAAKRKFGCAILWKSDAFECVLREKVDFDVVHDRVPPTYLTDCFGQVVILKTMKTLPSVELVKSFRAKDQILDDITVQGDEEEDEEDDKEKPLLLMVGNCQVFWAECAMYEKVRQSMIMLDTMWSVEQSYMEGFNEKRPFPMLLCGGKCLLKSVCWCLFFCRFQFVSK